MYWGWLPSVTLAEFLRAHPENFAATPYVLISSIDSDPNVGMMPWAFERMRMDPHWAISRSPLVISGSDALQLLDDPGIFSGFDEVWIPSDLPTSAPPPEAYLVAPRRLDRSLPASVATWMEESGCRFGLGDGDGLNYVAANSDLLTQLGLPWT